MTPFVVWWSKSTARFPSYCSLFLSHHSLFTHLVENYQVKTLKRHLGFLTRRSNNALTGNSVWGPWTASTKVRNTHFPCTQTSPTGSLFCLAGSCSPWPRQGCRPLRAGTRGDTVGKAFCWRILPSSTGTTTIHMERSRFVGSKPQNSTKGYK